MPSPNKRKAVSSLKVADNGNKKMKADSAAVDGGKNISSGNKDTKQRDNDFSLLTLEDIRDKIKSLCNRIPDIPDDNFYLHNQSSPLTESNESPPPAASVSDAGEDTATNTTSTSVSNNPLDVAIDEKSTREWAAQLQAVLEEYNLLVCCVATATYQWGTEKSGASDQNLGLLNNELASSQDSISSTVTPRLTNILAPVVDLVIDKTITTYRYTVGGGDGDEDGKQQHKVEDQLKYRQEIKQNYFTRKLGASTINLL